MKISEKSFLTRISRIDTNYSEARSHKNQKAEFRSQALVPGAKFQVPGGRKNKFRVHGSMFRSCQVHCRQRDSYDAISIQPPGGQTEFSHPQPHRRLYCIITPIAVFWQLMVFPLSLLGINEKIPTVKSGVFWWRRIQCDVFRPNTINGQRGKNPNPITAIA